MKGHLLYIIGQPGSGKSTLLAGLTEGLKPVSVETKPFAHILWGEGIAELGARREGGFGGTDALSLSVQPRVLEWLQTEAPPYVIGEGDRLANLKFFQAASGSGWDVDVIQLSVSRAVADYRRTIRAVSLAKAPQNPTWVAGRISKVRNLAEDWPVLVIDADGPPERVLAAVRRTGNPVLEQLDALIASTP